MLMGFDREAAPTPVERSVVVFTKYRVLSEAVGRGLADTGLRALATPSTVDEAFHALRRFDPDVLLIVVDATEGSGAQYVRSFSAATNAVRSLVMPFAVTEGTLVQLIRAGAHGYITTGIGLVGLASAIRRVAEGEILFPTSLLRSLASGANGRVSERGRQELTQRELDILQHLTCGSTTEAMAEELILSVNTVRNHIAKILMKLEVHSRVEAVAEAQRRGLVVAPTLVHSA